MFDNWPVDIKEDLRILRRDRDVDLEYRMVYSFHLDALTAVGLDVIEQLLQLGVQEIDQLPD